MDYDILVVGGGIAGLTCATELAGKCNLAVISKVNPIRSNSVQAQGGVNAVIRTDSGDSPELHLRDTLNAGVGLCDSTAVETLVSEAKDAIISLERKGVLFDRTPEGEIAVKKFGAQTKNRTCYSKDKTGQTILITLYEQMMKHKIPILEEYFVLKLIIIENSCKGVIVLDIKTGDVKVITAKSVILATGGIGQIYLTTTNSALNTADGQALILKEKLPLMDMEFIQFHPTGIYPKGILIGESARAQGGVLVNSMGEKFMNRYAPEKKELATRDVVARAVQSEIDSGRGIERKGYVNLDLTEMPEKEIKKNLPQTYEIAKDFLGIDCSKEKIPVLPTMHYSMGGIPTTLKTEVINEEYGQKITGLFAAGECACLSVHGANRLGGNSLLETIVFGRRAAKFAFKFVSELNFDLNEDQVKRILFDEQKRLIQLLKSEGDESLADIRLELKKSMNVNCGIFREARRLKKTIEKIDILTERLKKADFRDKSRVYNSDLLDFFEIENMLNVARAVVASALGRTESRGAHLRLESPGKDDKNWLKHTLAYLKIEGIELKYVPVDGELRFE